MIPAVEGGLSAEGKRFAIVVSRFNAFITERLFQSAYDGVVRSGARKKDVALVRVPGAFEIPSASRMLALTGKYDAIVCIGCLLRGIEKDQIERGQVLAKPGSITPHKKFTGEVYVLKKEEGGRHTPFFTNYRPQFYMRTTDVTGTCQLPEGTKMVMPGDNIKMTIELITPVGLEEQMRFAIREGGRTVGAGIVTKVLE